MAWRDTGTASYAAEYRRNTRAGTVRVSEQVEFCTAELATNRGFSVRAQRKKREEKQEGNLLSAFVDG